MGPPFVDRVRGHLAEGPAEWPGPIEWVPVLPSTSDLLKERCRAGAPAWSAVVAGEQTAGRGRQGNAWVSPRGNLFLSVLLRPEMSARTVSLLPLATGVAVRDALLLLGLAGELKWPNDVLVSGRKIAGVLVEASWAEGRLDGVVVGVGVNVDLAPDALPATLSGRTTSLAVELGRTPSLEAAAAAVLGQLALWYHRLAARGEGEVVEAWRACAASWWGRLVEVGAGERVLRGVARGIDEGGALLVEDASGVTHAVRAGEARALRLE